MRSTIPHLRLHDVHPHTRANGPGVRCCVWVQGCTLGCAGCFNEPTHTRDAGKTMHPQALAETVAALPGIEGVTVSGGEPLQQLLGVFAFLNHLKLIKPSLSVVLFTGYTTNEINKFARQYRQWLLHYDLIDVLITGRYDQTRRIASGLVGSASKEMHFLTSRYTSADFINTPQAQLTITNTGEIISSGIDPVLVAA